MACLKSYFMWDSFMVGVLISIMMNSEKYIGVNDYAKMEYMNITVITSNKPYGAHDDSNPLFGTPRFNLQQGGVHSGHVQIALDYRFCIVNTSFKAICEVCTISFVRPNIFPYYVSIESSGGCDVAYLEWTNEISIMELNRKCYNFS